MQYFISIQRSSVAKVPACELWDRWFDSHSATSSFDFRTESVQVPPARQHGRAPRGDAVSFAASHGHWDGASFAATKHRTPRGAVSFAGQQSFNKASHPLGVVCPLLYFQYFPRVKTIEFAYPAQHYLESTVRSPRRQQCCFWISPYLLE